MKALIKKKLQIVLKSIISELLDEKIDRLQESPS